MISLEPAVYSLKRNGANIQDCEAEPVRTPGCIQPHGVLIAFRPADLVVLQISENSSQHLGIAPQRALGQTLAAIFGRANAACVHDALASEPVERSPVYVFTTTPGQGAALRFDATLHTIDGTAILELEPAAGAWDLRSADHYALARRISVRLRGAPRLAAVCALAVREIRAATALDRVMVYRFLPDASGEVFAEDKRDDLAAWLGLRYPATDIPASVRELYRRLTVRPVPDAHSAVAELVPLANPETGRALDLTHCALRGASVMYTEYLANMGVAASLTMPILRDGELWGLVACHHLTPVAMPYPLRAAAEFMALMLSVELRAAEDRESFDEVQRIDAVNLTLAARAADAGSLAAMAAPGLSPTLCDGIRCNGAAVLHREQWWPIGHTPGPAALLVLGKWLREQLQRAPAEQARFATDHLSAVFAPGADIVDVASGILAVPLSKSCRSMIVWFRGETPQTFEWGGNPHEKPTVVGPHGPRLTPRASFDVYRESVHERSVPWQAVELDAAEKLRVLVMDLVVTRAEQLAALNTDLIRSYEELDSFAYVASHDLKEPLRGIHHYARHVLEEAQAGRGFDAAAQERLGALLRLTTRMDSLLDSLLRFSRVGRLELEHSDVDLDEVVLEAVEMLGARAIDPTVRIVMPRSLGRMTCDRTWVREVFANLISNALKYNEAPVRHVAVDYVDAAQADAVVLRSPAAAAAWRRSQRIFQVSDNGIGIDPRHHTQVFEMFRRLHAPDAYEGGTGVGLAIVRKLVERHGGISWVESSLGKGATFFFTLAGAEESPPRPTVPDVDAHG